LYIRLVKKYGYSKSFIEKKRVIKVCSGLTKRETRAITQIPPSEYGKLIYSGTSI